MMGCYDFCGHYEWTFAWLERTGGQDLLRSYWQNAIGGDSQRHARDLIVRDGFAGMAAYWGHTLAEESPDLGFSITQRPEVFRIDIRDCPSKGFLLRNGLAQYPDYCDHCIGWIRPLMREAGFVVDHEHNHCGQCWWEMRRAGDGATPSATGAHAGPGDVRLQPGWLPRTGRIDRFAGTEEPDAPPASTP